MVADQPYITGAGAIPYEARHATLLNMINGIYLGQTGRQFKIVISIGDFGNTFLTAAKASALHEQLRRFIDFAGGASDPNGPGALGMRALVGHEFGLAHLTTAKDLEGNTNGFTPTTSRFGLSQQAVFPPGGGSTALIFQNMMVAAHEIGHTFGAIHADAECICVDEGWFGCNDYQRTLMWREFIHDNQPRFSDKNRKTVRDTMTNLQL